MRHILSFPFATQRFNYRVAALIVVEGHVLVCREEGDDYVMLPGGRVELGEASACSLAREIEEEIGLAAEIGALVLTSESFYRREGEDFHEIGFFHSVRFAETVRPNGHTPWLTRRDEVGKELHFSWVPLTGNALEAINLMPGWLPERLREMPQGLSHVVYREGAQS